MLLLGHYRGSNCVHWGCIFCRGSQQEFYATIFRATNYYYRKDIKGLRRPPQNSFWRKQLKVEAWYDQQGVNDITHTGGFMGGVDKRFNGDYIRIFNPQRKSMEIYSSVIHNLAHASHWRMSSRGYGRGSDLVIESWARGVEHELTRIVYPNYKSSIQYISNNNIFSNYTDIVEDMIDGISGYDQVSNYTINQLEEALLNKTNWNDWEENIYSKYSNSTKGNLEALFNYWK